MWGADARGAREKAETWGDSDEVQWWRKVGRCGISSGGRS